MQNKINSCKNITQLSTKILQLLLINIIKLLLYQKYFICQLKKRDQNLQLKKQFKDILISIKNGKLRKFAHLLAQKIANNNIINLIHIIKYIKSIKLIYEFSKTIIIKKKKKVI